MLDAVNHCDKNMLLDTCKKRMRGKRVINEGLPVGSQVLPKNTVHRRSVKNHSSLILIFSICLSSSIIKVPISCLIPPFPAITRNITTTIFPTPPNPSIYLNHLYPEAPFSQHLGRPNLQPTINPQVFSAMPLDRRVEQPLMHRPGKLLAEYVTHQGQRILKNLVNTTIAELVAQSTVRIVNPNKLVNGQQSSGSTFPAMGRLYTLLFPTQAPNITTTTSTMESASTITSQQLDSEQKQIQSSADFGLQESESSTTGSEQQFANFHHITANQADDTQTSSNNMQHLMGMSMGAPYDPRPRSNPLRVAHGSMPVSRPGDWHRPEESLMQQSSGLFMTSGSEQHVESNPGEGIQEQNEIRSSDLVDDDSMGSNYGEQVQATAHNGAVDVQETTDGNEQDSAHRQISLDSSTDFSSLYRPTQASDQEQQVPMDSKRGEESSEVNLGPPNTPEEESFVAPISQQLVEAELVQPNGGNESSLEQSSPFAVGAEDFGDQFSQTTNLTSFEHQVAPSDDSYFTAHLPVQYETALRAPPEGHYDDYFKLLSNNMGASSEAVDNELKNQLAIQSQEDSAAFFAANLNDHLGNRSARHFVQDNKLVEVDSPVRRPRDHSGVNYDSLNGTAGLQYEVQHIYEREPDMNQSFTQGPFNDSQQMDPYNQSEQSRLRGSMGQRYEHFQHRNSTNPNEDNLQVIIAKTNYGRDPLSQEKVINYTSENHNFTWSGKSPRNNFVNKDMNEMPIEPLDVPNFGRFGSMPSTNSFRSPPIIKSGGLDVSLSSPPLLPPPPSPSPPPPPAQDQHFIVGNLASGSIRSPLPTGQFERLHLNGGQIEPQLMQIVEIHPKGQQNDVTVNQPMHLVDAIQTIVDRQQSQSSARQDQQQRQTVGERKRARGQSKREKRFRSQKPHRSSSANKATSNNGQPKRPQVTQVHLEQQNEPTTTTASASSPESSGNDGQAEVGLELKLPGKMKQLREHPPDKNELMNELLSALDRVKVAIYKLQPLTAKMNAIYRKSVTSNTRDIIMDKNKGTYAKRYPPGDYDDIYDRVQPTEIAKNEMTSPSNELTQSHQASSLIPDRSNQPEALPLSSSTMATAEVTDEPIPRVGAELESSDSDTRAIYMRAPRGRLSSFNGNSTKTPRRLRRRVTSLELESLNPAESRVIATGIGRRLGDRNLATLDEKVSVLPDGPQNNQIGSSPQDLLANQESFVGGPLFGYRITIYQKPGDQETDSEGGSKFAYRVDGLTEPVASSGGEQNVELMTTSESSIVDYKSAEVGSNSDNLSGSQKKSGETGKQDDNWKKSDLDKKEDGKEGKQHKEYKKIKHNKGVLSKEKKSMRRDKNVKAHDRGAAKEKALKERTQIEFFEREQIVDDEFEKAKKSNANSNWQWGHDSKKAIQAADLAADTISSGGSHYVNHRGPNEKSHTVGTEQTSGKKSSKNEKRHLEAKGKKFKGWREKGYKIITETEFIDRGSLHDSAYRKRDKGSASQQKYRRQHLASEGQHGSSIEHHKKLHKKEERREDAQQTKETRGKDDLKQENARNKKSSKKQGNGGNSADSNDIELSSSNKWEQMKRKRHPGLLSASSTTFRPASSDELPPKSLLRLLNAAHHEQNLDVLQFLNTSQPQNRKSSLSSLNLKNNDEPELSERRSDVATQRDKSGKSEKLLHLSQENASQQNGTVLDIVDNTTGHHLNKTKIGTYDLSQENEHNSRYNNNSIPFSKIADSLARYSAYLTRTQDKAAKTGTSTTTNKPVKIRTINAQKQVDSGGISEQQTSSNQSLRQQQPQVGSQNQNHNYKQDQNQHYNFNLLEYKRQLEMRANPHFKPYIPVGPGLNPMNQAAIDKQSIGQFVRPEQAEAAAQILRIVQRATMKESPIHTIPVQPSANFMDYLGPMHKSGLLAPRGMTPFGHIYPGTQQALTQPLTFMHSPITYGMNPFGPNQFNDYEHQSYLA